MRPNTSSLKPTISEATAPRPILSTPSSSAPPWSTSPSTLIGIDLDIVELDAGSVVRIDHHRSFGRDALCLRIDQKQRQPVALAGGAAGARGDDQEIGGVAVDHQGLVAVELESVAGAHRRHFGLQRSMLCAFIDRERGEQRAVGNFRQMLPTSAPRCRRATARRPPARRWRGTATASRCGRSPPSRRRPRRSRARCRRIFPAPAGRKSPSRQTPSRARGKTRWRPCCRASCRRCDTGALSLIRPRALSRSMDCSSVRTRAIEISGDRLT